MIMDKNIYYQAVKEKHPEAALKKCYEAIANGKVAHQTEMHGFVVDDKYFVNAKTMEVCDKSQFICVENIEDALLD